MLWGGMDIVVLTPEAAKHLLNFEMAEQIKMDFSLEITNGSRCAFKGE